MTTDAASPLRNFQLLDEGGRGGVAPAVRRDLSMLRMALTKQWVVLSPEEMLDLKQRAQAIMDTAESPRTQLSAIGLVVEMAKVNNQTADRIIKSLEAEEKINEGHEDDETPTRPTVVRVKTIEDGHRVLDAMREGPVEVEVDDGPVAEVAAALDAIAETAEPEPAEEQQPPVVEASHEGNGNGHHNPVKNGNGKKRRFNY